MQFAVFLLSVFHYYFEVVCGLFQFAVVCGFSLIGISLVVCGWVVCGLFQFAVVCGFSLIGISLVVCCFLRSFAVFGCLRFFFYWYIISSLRLFAVVCGCLR